VKKLSKKRKNKNKYKYKDVVEYYGSTKKNNYSNSLKQTKPEDIRIIFIMSGIFFSESQPILIEWLDAFSQKNNWISSDSLDIEQYTVHTMRVFNYS
jgi:hypothetical protein